MRQTGGKAAADIPDWFYVFGEDVIVWLFNIQIRLTLEKNCPQYTSKSEPKRCEVGEKIGRNTSTPNREAKCCLPAGRFLIHPVPDCLLFLER
ncbi:MAG: hypothetical protein IPJ06_15370 [Saprospiraceae bacterium]|nr:hypothetical protein [Saprospiraceae bacterium]